MSDFLTEDDLPDTPRSSETMFPVSIQPSARRAAAVSVAFHVALILLLIFGLPHIRHKTAGLPTQHAIAITMLATPPATPVPSRVLAPEPAAVPAQAEAAPAAQPDQQPDQQPVADAGQPETREAESATQTTTADQAAEDSAGTIPPDPGFNPFALAPSSQVQQSVQAESSSGKAVRAEVAPANPGPAVEQARPAPQPSAPSPSGGGAPTLSGVGPAGGAPGGDGKRTPQYLQIQLRGYINVIYGSELHNVLQRLIDCGVEPISSKNPALIVEADVAFYPTGALQWAHLTNEAVFHGDPGYAAASRTLMESLQDPSCTNIHLPMNVYSAWHIVHISFYQRIPGNVSQ